MVNKHIGWMFLLSAAIALIQCRKKTDSVESVLAQKEEARIATAVPGVDWMKTIAIQPFKKPPRVQATQSIVFTELTDGVAARLSRAKELKVVMAAPNRVAQTVRQKADYILTGESEAADPLPRLAIQLVDVRKNTRLWEIRLDVDSRRLFTLIYGIADSVLARLHIGMSGRTGIKISDPPGDVMEAYIEGKRYMNKNNHIASDLAVQNFKVVLRTDSTFTPAWLALGETYLGIHQNGWDRNMVWFHLAQQTAFKVLQLDSTSAEAMLILGRVYQGLGDLKKAEEQYRKALGLNPSLKDAWFGLGSLMTEYGLYLPALDVFNRSLELDPVLSPASLGKALVLIGLRHYADAETTLRQALSNNPDAPELRATLALARLYQNDSAGAEAELKRDAVDGETSVFHHAVRAMVWAKQERFDQAIGELELNVIPSLHDDASLFVAVSAVYALLNRPGLCVQWLQKACDYGYKQYLWIQNDPHFKDMQGDARFNKVVRCIRREWEKRALGSS